MPKELHQFDLLMGWSLILCGLIFTAEMLIRGKAKRRNGRMRLWFLAVCLVLSGLMLLLE